MDYVHGLLPAHATAAAKARIWTSDPNALIRLDCIYCFDIAEESALENDATDDVAIEWAASYISQGDSTPCHRHNGE